ncbi:hypothetical protein D9619_006819 [Psilocybe cf. subviscida]|uniref:Uncharacterized protein n=1 Tax=Psilocybe cf. subviscida TaxID=2480587 RepID=A0A8H5B3X1_9AGAR|nr:hypothetical protein D9619_006819 [Psilocybe cf. subviscida]
MRLFTPSLLLLAWSPWSVLGDIAVAVQTNGGVLKPGQVLNYVVSASPIPPGTLGMVLIGVSAPGETGGRVFWPWSLTMSSSPKQGAITIPSGVPPKFYTVDVHANTSVYSPLLASSNAFEIVSNAPPTTQVTTSVVQSTKQTTIVTTQQTVIQQPAPPSPQPQPDPTSQNPVVTKPVTTQDPPNAPSSNAPSNTNSGSTTGQTGSTGSSQTPSQTASSATTDPAPTPSADTSLDVPPTTNEKKKSSPIGPAVGGAVGGILVILLLFFLWRRYNKKKHERLALDEMAESNSRYRDAEGAATPATSPFANTFREFQPNRGNTAVSPFLLDSERSPPATSPEPTMSSKYREAYGGGAGHSGQTHHQNTSFGASTGYFESTSGTGGTSEQLRSERERVLGEISALRSRGGQPGSSAYAQSSVSAGSSGGRDAADEEMRNRLDMLTQHVARLENALEQAVHVYEAPPTYHQAPSQAVSQRG